MAQSLCWQHTLPRVWSWTKGFAARQEAWCV